MVSFWDHMKSVLKTIKKNSTLVLVKGRDPARSWALPTTAWLSGYGGTNSLPGVVTGWAKTLLAAFGSSESVLRAGESLQAVHGLTSLRDSTAFTAR